MVPDFFSSAKRRMVSMGMKKSNTTLMLVNSGRITLSVMLRFWPMPGCMNERIEMSL
jgi:hypothetical protein